MHVRVATVHFQIDKLQQGINLYRDSLVPAAKGQRGFQGAYLMTDAGSGKAVNITVWDTEVDMTESESSSGYNQEQLAIFASLFVGPLDIDHYELSVEASA